MPKSQQILKWPQRLFAKAALLRHWPALVTAAAAVGLAGCSSPNNARNDQLLQRQEQMQLQIEQLERRLNQLSPPASPEASGKPPAGPVKSLTYRSGTSDDRLRIYWSDGKVSDLPCTKEQNTLVCG